MTTTEWVVVGCLSAVAVGLMLTSWWPVGLAMGGATAVYLAAAWIEETGGS